MNSRQPSASSKKPAVARPGRTSPAAKKKIMLVDDHPLMRAGLAQFINKQPDLEVCAEHGSAAEALEGFSRAAPDLVLSDITLPGRSGLELIKDLLAVAPGVPILVVSMHDETVYAERVLRAGARGYIMKESGGENLLIALRQVLGGQVYVSPRISAKILEGLASRKPRGSVSPVEKLSDREFEIFQLIGQGKGTRDIAAQLHLSPKTVEVHRGHIKAKLALKNSTALVHQAIRWYEMESKGEN